jgi:hypothetical protein
MSDALPDYGLSRVEQQAKQVEDLIIKLEHHPVWESLHKAGAAAGAAYTGSLLVRGAHHTFQISQAIPLPLPRFVGYAVGASLYVLGTAFEIGGVWIGKQLFSQPHPNTALPAH